MDQISALHLNMAFIYFLLIVSFLTYGQGISSQIQEHYAIVVDAGSSGSRCFLYKWPAHTGNSNDLLKITPLKDEDGEPLVHFATPGLSTYGSKPEDVFEKHVKDLMQFAEKNIPVDQHNETPLFILATAGMRLIETDQREAIMRNVRQGIQSHFQFQFPDSNLEIISGTQEGIYQWLAINYVLNRFETKGDVNHRPGTVGAIDMGGASMQIAVEVPKDINLNIFSEKDKPKVVDINLGCRDSDQSHRYRLFVTTFLGYGANEAIARYHRYLVLSQFEEKYNTNRGDSINLLGIDPEHHILDPCLPLNLKQNISIHFDVKNLINAQEAKSIFKDEADRIMVYAIGTGDWDKCYETMSQFVKSSEPYFLSCSSDDPGCPNAGIKMPPIPLEHTDFYGFSEFWYTTEDIVHMGGLYSYDNFANASREYCASNWETILNHLEEGKYITHDVHRLQEQCLKSAWLTVALHEGFKFPKTFKQLTSASNAVNGQVVSWTIGALLYRTRDFPLRAMQQNKNIVVEKEVLINRANQEPLDWDYQLWHYIVLFILAVVLTSGLVYLKRCKRYVKPSAMRKVESLSFLRNSSTSSTSSIPNVDVEKGSN